MKRFCALLLLLVGILVAVRLLLPPVHPSRPHAARAPVDIQTPSPITLETGADATEVGGAL